MLFKQQLICGHLQVLQDMGLPTGVELKTVKLEEAVKSEEAVVAAAVEELKPTVATIETTTAATGAVNADTSDAAEVQSCSVSQQEMIVSIKVSEVCPNFTYHLSYLSDCSPTGTNSDQTWQEPRDGAEREAPRPEVRAHL